MTKTRAVTAHGVLVSGSFSPYAKMGAAKIAYRASAFSKETGFPFKSTNRTFNNRVPNVCPFPMLQSNDA
jgi:hypothetical protein